MHQMLAAEGSGLVLKTIKVPPPPCHTCCDLHHYAIQYKLGIYYVQSLLSIVVLFPDTIHALHY